MADETKTQSEIVVMLESHWDGLFGFGRGKYAKVAKHYGVWPQVVSEIIGKKQRSAPTQQMLADIKYKDDGLHRLYIPIN